MSSNLKNKEKKEEVKKSPKDVPDSTSTSGETSCSVQQPYRDKLANGWISLGFSAIFILVSITIWFGYNIYNEEENTQFIGLHLYHLCSVLSALATIITCSILFGDYRLHKYHFYHDKRAYIIAFICAVDGIIFVPSSAFTILPSSALLLLSYCLYISLIDSIRATKANKKNEDLLYRSRLFNQTHQEIRKLAAISKGGLTIGICGQWGSGKTFFLDTLLYDLSKEYTSTKASAETWNDSFILCEKVELWETSSLNDAWERVICSLHKGLFNRTPISYSHIRKLVNIFSKIFGISSDATNDIIDLVCPGLSEGDHSTLRKHMEGKKTILVFDNLERADFKIIQAMLPLFERLKTLPNLIVICTIAEDELKQAFRKNRVNPDFSQGHLAKIFDLRIEMPHMSYSAIRNFNNETLRKYRDCKIVRSFLQEYPLRFETARQALRTIEKLTSIERQYFSKCNYDFKIKLQKPSVEKVLYRIKYIFLVETLRMYSRELLVRLYQRPDYIDFISKTPKSLVANSKYEIMEDNYLNDSSESNSEDTSKWINKNQFYYRELAKRGLAWSIFSYFYIDIRDDTLQKRDFQSAYNAYYTRCAELNEWEMQEISETSDYQGIPYSEKVKCFFTKQQEIPEPSLLPQTEFELFKYELSESSNNLQKLLNITCSLNKEYDIKDNSNIFDNTNLSSRFFLWIIEDLGYNQENTQFNFSTIEAFLHSLFKVMPIDEQAHILTPYFHRCKHQTESDENTELGKFADWLSRQPTYQKFIEKLCYEYGKNLAYHIDKYKNKDRINLQSFTHQAYIYTNEEKYIGQVKKGLEDYICQLNDKLSYITSWIEFISCFYREPLYDIYSTFATEEVYDMMFHIKGLLLPDSFDYSNIEIAATIQPVCKLTLDALRDDRRKWEHSNHAKREQYMLGLSKLINMVEGLQRKLPPTAS